jgi:hypothetical protein
VTQLHPDHFLVRRAEMVLWLSGLRECIEDQAPDSTRKRDTLKMLDTWLDDLPTFAMIMQ